VPGDQKLADSVHINSDMRRVCLQLLAADCQARPLSNSCSVAANFGQLLRGLTDPWSTLPGKKTIENAVKDKDYPQVTACMCVSQRWTF